MSMNIEGAITRLRALEPYDIETMYAWENDTQIWSLSGTTSPFSRHALEGFIDQQRFDIYQTRQLRLVIETRNGLPIGAIDLFEFDPQHLRAGVGILIHDTEMRGKGYGTDALESLCAYGHDTLNLHQLWCNIGANNPASLGLFRKVGFTEVGCKKEWHRSTQGYTDEIMMQKLFK